MFCSPAEDKKGQALLQDPCNIFHFYGRFQGHSVNVLTIDHVTPLHEACVGDHVACARALIDAGANVSHALASIIAMSHRSHVISAAGESWVAVTNEELIFFDSVALLSSPLTDPPGCRYLSTCMVK